MHTETFTCDSCGYSYPCTGRVVMDGQELCRNCSEEETYLCASCGERIWQDDNAGDEDVPLCQSCYDRHYTNCIRCNAMIHMDDACYSEDDPAEEEPLCHDCCYHPCESKVIQDYYYKPDPIFYGEGPRYFGVELEMDNGGEISSRARELLELANRWAQEEGEEEFPQEVTQEDFMSRMELDAVQVYEDGAFDFWFNDGDLFWGHSIHVTGSLGAGPEDAQMEG